MNKAYGPYRKKSEQILWDVYRMMSDEQIYALWESQRRKKERKWHKLIKMAENFPKLGKDMDIYIYVIQKSPSSINPEMISPRHSFNQTVKVSYKENFEKGKRKIDSLLTRGS